MGKAETQPIGDVRADMSDELDRSLLKQIKDGVEVVTKQGEVVTIDAPAALLNTARQRLRDLGMTKQFQEGDDASKLAQELGIVEMPPISDEPDAATA